MSGVGEPLGTANSAEELLTALLDAILGEVARHLGCRRRAEFAYMQGIGV